MGIIELILISVSLAMDAFAVSLCKGLNMRKINLKQAGLIALFFGGFQALMPLIGWALGRQFESFIVSIDHWAVFVLLSLIGGKMIFDAVREMKAGGDCCDECEEKFSIKELFVLAIATSIDALAIGISFAFLNVNIVSAVASIGIITFALSLVGVFIGHAFGAKFKSKAALSGGVVLVTIGLKILLEHLGVLKFLK